MVDASKPRQKSSRNHDLGRGEERAGTWDAVVKWTAGDVAQAKRLVVRAVPQAQDWQAAVAKARGEARGAVEAVFGDVVAGDGSVFFGVVPVLLVLGTLLSLPWLTVCHLHGPLALGSLRRWELTSRRQRWDPSMEPASILACGPRACCPQRVLFHGQSARRNGLIPDHAWQQARLPLGTAGQSDGNPDSMRQVRSAGWPMCGGSIAHVPDAAPTQAACRDLATEVLP